MHNEYTDEIGTFQQFVFLVVTARQDVYITISDIVIGIIVLMLYQTESVCFYTFRFGVASLYVKMQR